jgi:hypothetical protein
MLRSGSYPKPESDEVWRMSCCLADIASYLKDFGAAVGLFLFCEKESKKQITNPQFADNLNRWQLIACRDGAMTIYHFYKSMQAVRRSMKVCPTIMKSADHESLRDANRIFEFYFPTFAKIRHAVGHSGEIMKDRKNFERHAFSGSYEGPGIKIEQAKNVILADNLQEDRFTITYDGQVLTYDINILTYIKLGTIAAIFFRGFASLR